MKNYKLKMQQHLLKFSSKNFFIFLFIPLFLFAEKADAQCTNSGSALSATAAASNVSCSVNDGSITVSASNGYIDASAGKGTGYGYSITAGPITRITQSGNIFSALSAGSYTILVTDCHNDSAIVNATVGGTPPPQITFNPTFFKSVCAANNAVKIGPGGGRAPYSITLVSVPAGSVPVINGDTIRGLTAGTLNFTISDACGNQLGGSVSITTNYPVTMPTQLNYFGCSGSIDVFGQTHPPQLYYQYYPSVILSPVVDTFFVDMYYNNAYQQTLSGTGSGLLTFLFNNPGFGTYKFVNYTHCGGVFKTDSLTIGNRPSSPTGTNTNLAVFMQNPIYGCSTYDLPTYCNFTTLTQYSNVLGKTYDVLNAPYTLTIISGPTLVGNTFSSGGLKDTIRGLSYGATYQAVAQDLCGVADTFSFSFNKPLIKTPNITVSCGSLPSYVSGRFSPVLLRGNFPFSTPMKYTFISGTAIPWINGNSYPLTIVDSTGGYIPVLPATSLSGSYTIAYENTCGDMDTTTFTVNCSPLVPRVISPVVTPLCGNRANITLNQKNSSGAILNAMLISGPAGNTVSSSSAIDLVTYLSQPIGTYVFRATMSPLASSPQQQYADYAQIPSYNAEGVTTASGTSANGYPINHPTVKASYSFSGTVDTSQLRIWDTTFTVVVLPTALSPLVSDDYLCKGATTANILVSTPGNVSPFSYQYSLTGNSGPFSAAQSDSLLQIQGVTPGQTIYIKTTDGCGSSVIVSSTAGYLTSTVNSSCNNGIATLIPNPFSKDFVYELIQQSTGNVTTFSYPSAATVDLTNSANAGSYTVRFKLASGGSTSCIVDSTNLTLSQPCNVDLPVNYTFFLANSNNCNVTIQWGTAQEINTKSFVIESSIDGGRTWSIITTANAAGTSTIPKTYSVTVSPGSAKNLLYRLKEVDKDGKFSYSASLPVVVNCLSAENIFKASPNPVKQSSIINFQLSGNDARGNAYLVITDILGKRMVNNKVVISNGTNNYSLPTNNLIAGTYIARIITEDGSWQSNVLKIVISN